MVQVVLRRSIWQQLEPIWPRFGLGETSPASPREFILKSLLSEVFQKQSEMLQLPVAPVWRLFMGQTERLLLLQRSA